MEKQLRIQLNPIDHKCFARSEAKAILADAAGFKKIIFDFDGIGMVGQGFIDEIYRVFHNANPGVELLEANMNSDVAFMVQRSKPKELKKTVLREVFLG